VTYYRIRHVRITNVPHNIIMIRRVLRTWCTMRYVGRLRVTTDNIRRQDRIIRRIKDFTHCAHNVFHSYITMTAHDDIIINRNVTYFTKYIFLSWIFWFDESCSCIIVVRGYGANPDSTRDIYCYLLSSPHHYSLWWHHITQMITKPWCFWLK